MTSATPLKQASAPVEQIALPWPDAGALVLSREVHDVDAMAAHIEDGIEGEYVQLAAGPFCAHWTAMRLSSCVLQFSREDVAAVHRFRIPADRWVFFIPL